MKVNQPKVEFLKPAPPRGHLAKIPWVQTSGHPGSPYEYNNGVLAALHSLLAGMKCQKKKAVRSWLETAQGQLDDAVKAIKKSRAKVPPCIPSEEAPA